MKQLSFCQALLCDGMARGIKNDKVIFFFFVSNIRSFSFLDGGKEQECSSKKQQLQWLEDIASQNRARRVCFQHSVCVHVHVLLLTELMWRSSELLHGAGADAALELCHSTKTAPSSEL